MAMPAKITRVSKLLSKYLRRHCSDKNWLISRRLTTSASDQRETHFGFQSVQEDEKENKVHEVFENVAKTYDLMNDAMSCGVHRLWKDYFMEQVAPTNGTKLIDVAGGTGDIAFRFLNCVKSQNRTRGQDNNFNIEVNLGVETNDSDRTLPLSEDNLEDKFPCHVSVCDINQAMLDVGKERATHHGFTRGISWLKGNAECLPIDDNTYDLYTIAFGIRNCTHIDKVLEEAYRVLKPGGRFMCLEFSQVNNPLVQWAYDQYSFQVIPVIGQVLARDWKSYQYLVESIRQFPEQEEFAAMIRKAGFRMVSFENLTFGVAAIHSGFKLC
ncbi:2-methoxy-6-polyprenyl-1,4-benzoquinol methylase, mitochondrial-like [Gigantopelta aegis]|uniref:2-methoxy-6-polyprenyl-1,4-benzoquinol methylase, mitochondrial-like n=1 Tax=Gigantopelta aegis TaxID=1735272 RepID=UPI001B88B872|nr:2-methoxy-6-polyprenyl-1,4-benzoquinol methylase, mitochondrial-like [Gigantopelta aegis]